MNFKQKLFKISRQLLTIWGGISLLGVIIIGGYLFYSMTLGNTNIEDNATTSDVRFVLNWCGLGDQRIDKVLKSYTSARSFTGDHLDAYAIKITNVTIDELTSKSNNGVGLWYRADSLPTILDEAVTFIGGWQHETPWFPTEDSLRTKDFYVYPWSIYCHGVTPTATELIFVKPKEKMVYYVSAKM
ncbi:hypothetical protein [Hymenobacter actinosclerus]|uniref:Uncharacterized protein n=1 Tax=Hymenobacter actinosclerus TaxID=82805 RepID=A0A1I0FLY2_9BACT|nr:hypothetical protein [Hymenobacter actinosclerus]SET59312.1 hypothetical protein SAMN04487998_2329 [Hymenobacter actinosclerus]